MIGRFNKGVVLFLAFVAGAARSAADEPETAAVRLPSGPRFEPGERPRFEEPPACSAKRPVCVHRAPGVSPDQTFDALMALESAYEKLVLALDLPAPLADEGRGGGDELDAYVEPYASSSDFVSVNYDAPRLGGFDRASGFCRLAATAGIVLERAATMCVAEAIALGLDAAEGSQLRRAFATELWWIVGQPTVLDLEVIDQVQSHPEQALARDALTRASEGDAIFLDYLERTRSLSQPGALSAALISASAQKSTGIDPEWSNEPDFMDVVRHTAGVNRFDTVSLMREFAVSRAFMGSRDDGSNPAAEAWSGDFGRVRFDWVIAASSFPRRILLSRPLEPTGAVFVWLDLDAAAPGKTLALQANWEAPVAYTWSLVRVDPEGREMSRIDVPFQERASSAEARVSDLKGAAAVVLVGTFIDEVSLAFPFDPDVEPFESHGATLYVAWL